jgi:hypothetical protein
MIIRASIVLIVLLAALPARAQQRCLTPWLLEQHLHPESRKEPPRLPMAAVSRQTRQRNSVSPQGHFRVHYDRDGANAVDPVDGNANGIPDYIDSTLYYLDMAWQVEIVEMGYKPPTDKGIQSPEVDVFVSELDSAYYGVAYPEFDNEISSSSRHIAQEISMR